MTALAGELDTIPAWHVRDLLAVPCQPGTVLDLFAGPGGWDIAAHMLGLAPSGLEQDPVACATRILAGLTTTQCDVTRYPSGLAGKLWGLIGSPPCFPSETPVITARGTIRIEDVCVGDLVLTHRGRWRPVTSTMSRRAPVWSDRWLRTTGDHPFYARTQTVRPHSHGRRATWWLNEPEWTSASELGGRFLAIPAHADTLPVPSIAGRPVDTGPAFWYMIGRWVGDGWLRLADADPAPAKKRTPYSQAPRPCAHCGEPAARHATKGVWLAYCGRPCSATAARQRRRRPRAEIYICCAREEADGVESKLADTGLAWRRSEERTATRFTTAHTGLARWLADNFGRYAHGKTLPGWLFGRPDDCRSAVFGGYLDADGSVTAAGWVVSSVSQNLVTAMRVLATTLGYTTSIVTPGPRAPHSIEGRAVRQRAQHTLAVNRDDGRYTRTDDLHRWVKQRRPLMPGAEETVYDLTVDEDHSFVAHGFAVHNCTTFSQSGTRAALRLTAIIADAIRDTLAGRDTLAAHLAVMAAVLAGGGMDAADACKAAASALLMAEPARFIRDCRPEWIVLEQVPGARPLYEVYAAELAARGYHVWCGVLNAADYGVPQTRRRVVLIASKTRYVGRPAATHFDPAAGGQLFGRPWVPMSDVVGFGPDRAPSPVITGGGVATGGADPYAPGSRRALAREYAAGRWLAGAPNEFGHVRDAALGKVRLTPAGCAALQGFPYAYPWQGGKGRQHLQIGNAVPPGLGRAVLGEATGLAGLA